MNRMTLLALAFGLSTPAWAIPGLPGVQDSGDGEGTPSSQDDGVPDADEGDETISYIVNGREAEEGEFMEVPWVGITAPSGGGNCTGSLIDPLWVLTAAHCIPEDTTDITVVFGETAQDSGMRYRAESWLVDSRWDHQGVADQGNDIAVVKLAEPVNGVPIMALNEDKVQDSWIGTEVTFIGFGITGSNKSDSGIKRIGAVDLFGVDTDRVLTYDASQSTCQGDSGGPGIRYTGETYAQLSITSYGPTPCGSGPRGSMRVDSFLGWLRARSVPFTTTPSAPANFVCSRELDPESPDTIVLGVVDFDVKCQVDYHAPELLQAVRWQWGDGNTSEGVAVEHTYTTPGNFSVTMCADVATSTEPRTECVTKTGYITACDTPIVEFGAEQVDGLVWQMQNKTDVSTYGCLTNLTWEIYDDGGNLLESLKTWEPEVVFPEPGDYRVVLNIGGYAGVEAAELNITAKRGLGTNCNSVGGTAGFGAFGLFLAAAMIRRRRS